MTADRPPRRVTIVGPVTPFRSGIAKHTTELAKALAADGEHAVQVLSFARLYPRRLFPGSDDRAPDGAPPQDPPVDFILDTLNPLSWRRAVRRIRRHRPDLVLLPAWTFFVAPCLGWIARRCRRQGCAVVQVVHNVVDHEAAGWKSWLSWFQLRQSTRFVTHGRVLAEQLQARLADRPVSVHPHPIFEQYPDPTGSLPRRAGLELLFFGLVRAYKGLDVALRGLAASGLSDVRLSVVGEFWEGREETERLIQSLGLADRVDITARYVTDAEAAEVFHRADAVLLPYRTVSGSGVVPVAYRYQRPVLVTDLPGLTDVVRDGETGWIVPVGDPKAVAAVLRDRATAAATQTMGPAIRRMRDSLSWQSFAKAVIDG